MSTLFLTREQIAEFSRSGFLVLRSLVDEELVKELLEEISANLEPLREPIEFEADVGYPGAPARRESKGGKTPRRLLQALSRSDIFERILGLSSVKGALKDLLRTQFSRYVGAVPSEHALRALLGLGVHPAVVGELGGGAVGL